MKYSESNIPLVCMQTQSTCYKGTSKMNVLGVLWHSTGANNPKLSRYVQPSDNASNRSEMLKILGVNKNGNDWNHTTTYAGLNAWIGRLADNSVTSVQTMPWNFRPWGCANGTKGSCNDGWIQFEICEDDLSDREYFEAVYREACELTAYLCKLYGLDPLGSVTHKGVNVPVILCHQDSYKLKLGSNHGDIYHWFNRYGKNMDDVRQDVAELMKEEKEVTKEEVQAMIDASKEKVYHYWDELPDWAYKPIKALYNAGYFAGNSAEDLNLPYSTMRTLVVLARALKADGKLDY